MTAQRVGLTREIQGGSGYLSMNPKQQHFGLGRAESADLQIIWPNGEERILTDVEANRSYIVRQGLGIVLDPVVGVVESRGAPGRGGS